jgi:hypothetical protein
MVQTTTNHAAWFAGVRGLVVFGRARLACSGGAARTARRA